MARIFALLLASIITLPLAQAGSEEPGKGPWEPQPPKQEPYPPHDEPNPPHEGNALCEGRFEGYFYGQYGAATVEVVRAGRRGELSVTAWFRGGMWNGMGVCRQLSPWQASFEFYFPGAQVHRGVINGNGSHAVMEGQIDFGPGFHFVRR